MIISHPSGGKGGGSLPGQFRPVGGLGSHIFLLGLVDFGMEISAGALGHAPCRLFGQGLLPLPLFRFLKPECVLQPAFLWVKLLFQPQLFLFGDFLFCPFQLGSQDFRLVLGTGRPFLRAEQKPFAALHIVRVIDVRFSFHVIPLTPQDRRAWWS